MENDNIPQPLAEIPIGPSNFEQFLDRNQKSLIVLTIFIILLGAGVIIYKGIRATAESNASAALTLTYDEVTRKYDVQALELVTVDHAGTSAAETAAYLIGIAQWMEGKQDEAIKTMQNYISRSSGAAQERAIVELASFYHQMGNHEKAMEEYRKVVLAGNQVYAPFALISIGDIYRSLGDNDKAEQSYKEAILKYPNSSLSSRNENMPPSAADRRLDLLGVKDPDFRAPAPTLDTNILNTGEKPTGGVNLNLPASNP